MKSILNVVEEGVSVVLVVEDDNTRMEFLKMEGAETLSIREIEKSSGAITNRKCSIKSDRELTVLDIVTL